MGQKSNNQTDQSVLLVGLFRKTFQYRIAKDISLEIKKIKTFYFYDYV